VDKDYQRIQNAPFTLKCAVNLQFQLKIGLNLNLDC